MKSSIGIPQIHFVPFDLGYTFFDVLSLENEKNILFANAFVEALMSKSGSFQIKKNIKLNIKENKVRDFSYIDKKLADHVICICELADNLYCYVLQSGIGLFVLYDFEGEAIREQAKNLKGYSLAITAFYQKVHSQMALLGSTEETILLFERKVMLEFRTLCWKTVKQVAKEFRIKQTRINSSNVHYKSEGLSYVLTCYVLNPNNFNENEINFLMYSPMSSKNKTREEFGKVQKVIENFKPEHKNTEYSVRCGSSIIHCSWSAVSITTSNDVCSLDDIMQLEALTSLIKAEIYVQSRWFLADCSTDNITKSFDYSLESVQRLESLMEFYQFELDNDVSANMPTVYRKILTKVIETSAIRPLFKSVVNQLKLQRKIKETREKERKRRNQLIVNLFLAFFSASSLYKTTNEILHTEHSFSNALIFLSMLLIACGTILFNFFNNR